MFRRRKRDKVDLDGGRLVLPEFSVKPNTKYRWVLGNRVIFAYDTRYAPEGDVVLNVVCEQGTRFAFQEERFTGWKNIYEQVIY